MIQRAGQVSVMRSACDGLVKLVVEIEQAAAILRRSSCLFLTQGLQYCEFIRRGTLRGQPGA